MNTPPSNPVGPPKGYKTETDSMSSQAGAISDAAEDAQKDVEDLQPSTITDKEFGVKHVQWQKDYATGIEQLGKGAVAMCGNLTAFAGLIGSASQQYASNETAQANAAAKSGS